MNGDEVVGYAIVFAIAMIENIAAIPIGLLMGLDPLGVVVAGSAGALAMMILAIALGGPIVRWVMKDPKREERLESLRERSKDKIDRFGAPHSPSSALLSRAYTWAPCWQC